MLIGFTNKSSKKLSKLFCKNFKHCAVIFKHDKKYIFIQIALDGIKSLLISNKEIKLLQSAGWIFIKISDTNIKNNKHAILPSFLTCVGFAKRAIGLHKPFIWTPDSLYKYLKNRR